MGSSKDHFLDFMVLLPKSQKYFREYLCANENIFDNILGHCSRAQVLSICAKNQSSKISCYKTKNLHGDLVLQFLQMVDILKLNCIININSTLQKVIMIVYVETKYSL